MAAVLDEPFFPAQHTHTDIQKLLMHAVSTKEPRQKEDS